MTAKIEKNRIADFNAEELYRSMAKLPKQSPEPPVPENMEPLDIENLKREVAEGTLDPEQADRCLTDRWLKPFTQVPKTPDIWSNNAPAWSIEMVASWIIWTDRDLTLRHFQGSFEHASIWVSNAVLLPFINPKPPGYKLHKFEKTNVMDKFIGYDGRSYSFFPFEAWKTGLIARLITSKITCSAVQTGGAQSRVNVLAKEWETAEFDSDARHTVLSIDGKIKYSELLFLASEVLEAYPEQKKDRLRKWKINPRLNKLSPKQRKIYDIIRREYKNGIPIGEAAKRNRDLEKKAYENGISQWKNASAFARFVDTVLEITCDKKEGGPGRPRKS